MPKRIPAVPSDMLRREAESLPDSTLVLPEQVKIIIGMGVDELAERRKKPPKPPLVKPGEGLPWYTLGELRRYNARQEKSAAVDEALAKNKRDWRRRSRSLWPVAFIGRFGRPVDFFST